jgi:hypothetical protein
MKNNLPTAHEVRRQLSRIWAGALGALLCASATAPSLAADPKAPAPGVNCIASAQNRSTPLRDSFDYVLENLPGSGIAPFGVGAVGQPFRVRVTCDDGTVGETPLAFPQFEQDLIIPDPIVWGLKTPVPEWVRLELGNSTIAIGAPLQSLVTARYPDGAEKNVTARATGTGYRSSSAGFVGVNESGQVFVQDGSTIAGIANVMPIPTFVTITAENDGVQSSRLIKLVGPAQVTGRVTQVDGKSAANLEVRLSISGYDDVVGRTDAQGNYRFTDLPFMASRSAVITVIDRANRRAARQPFWVDARGNSQSYTLQLGAKGIVRVKVVDTAGMPQPGVEVGVSDLYARVVSGGGLPTQRTDARGEAYFDDVLAGEVSPLGGVAGYVPEPGVALLPAGGFTPFLLRGYTAGGASSGSTISGSVLQLPTNGPAVGASVELSRVGVDGAARQVIDGNGSFAFRGLLPNTDYDVIVKFGGDAVSRQTVLTGAVGSEVRIGFLLPQLLGMSGLVVADDGSTPVAGVMLQASYWNDSMSTWQVSATTKSRADGTFAMRFLEQREYRLEGVTDGGASGRVNVDLRAQPAGSLLQNVRLQLTDQAIQTRVGVLATVMGAANYGAMNAQLSVTNARCPAGCVLTTLAFAGQRFESELLPQGTNQFELRWGNRVQSFTIDVSAATNGQTIERTINFGPDASGVNRIALQRSLYSFNATAGDAIDAAVLGVGQAGQPAARAVKLQLYGPDGVQLAEGQGFDPAMSANPAANALNGVAARESGRHTLVVSPLTADAVNLGGYGVQVNVAGGVPGVQAWTAVAPARFGAQLSGRVLKKNGDPAANTPVLVRAGAADKIQLVELVDTDAQGAYAHLNVPLGPLEASVLDGGTLVLAKAKGEAAADGDRVVLDLRLAARTVVALSLRLSQDLLADGPIGTLPVELVDDLNQRRVDVAFDPVAVTATVETAVAGDRALARFVHPRNARLVAQRVIDGDDGNRVEVEVALPTGAAGGRALSGTGQYVAGLQVRATDADGLVLGDAMADDEGRFAIKLLPADTRVTVRVRDVELGLEAMGDVLVRESVQVSADDLVLPTMGVEGAVLFNNGAPVSGVTVEAAFGGPAPLQQVTDADGQYAFPRLPAARLITITAKNPATGAPASVDVAGTVGEYAQAPEIFFEIVGATVQGRVRNASGRPLVGVNVVISDNGVVADCAAGGDLRARGAMRSGARGTRTAASSGNGFAAWAVTDAQGRFSVANVPQGHMLITAAVGLTCQVVDAEVDVGAPGTVLTVGDLVFADMGSMLLRVVEPSGQPFDVPNRYGNECVPELRLTGPGLTQSMRVPDLQGTRYEGVPYGRYDAELYECSSKMGEGAVDVNDANPVNLDVVVALIKGQVTYADGSPVTYGSVNYVQRDGRGNRSESYTDIGRPLVYGETIAANAYVLYGGFGPGEYELWLRDNDTGVQQRWTGNYVKLPGMPRNLVFPAMAQLQGCVTQANGQPAAATRVRAISAGLGNGNYPVGHRDAFTSGGCYKFDRLPAGETILHVFEGELLKAVESVTLAPATDKALVQRNVQYLAMSRAVVQATTNQGQALSNRRVLMQTQQVEQGLSYNEQDMLTASNGYGIFSMVPGPYTANQVDTWWANRELGRTSMRLAPGATVEASVVYSNSYKFVGSTQDAPTVPDGMATFMFDEAGKLWSAGAVQFFTNWTGPQLLINGLPMPRSQGMDYTVGNREMALGPFEYGDRLQVNRRVYVPETGGYARELETLTNNSARSVTVRVEIMGGTDGYCEAFDITQPQYDASRGYVAYKSCAGTGAHVYGGVGAAAGSLPASRVDMRSERGSLTQWVLTLAPGQTAALMHFHVLMPGDGAAALADELARGTEPRMLEGMSAEDRRNVRNFAIGQ